MSHVDEGELTAYADGAYPPGDANAQRIEAHLALCENCRNRLDQARALSDRATQILAVAAPIDVTVPEFAEIRSAAAAVRRRKSAVPLSWAATVILALGLGWFGRGALQNPALERAAMSARPEMQQAADMTAAAPAPTPAPAPPPELRASHGSGTAAERSGAELSATREERQAANVANEAIVADAITAPSASAPVLSEAESRPLVGRTAGVAQPVDYITAAEAEKRGIRLHMVPELEIVRVGLRADEVSVEQKLPDGKIVTITSNRLAMAEADLAAKTIATPAAPPSAARVQSQAEGAAARARDQAPQPATEKVRAEMRRAAEISVEVKRGALRLRASAVLPEDSLRALIAKIR